MFKRHLFVLTAFETFVVGRNADPLYWEQGAEPVPGEIHRVLVSPSVRLYNQRWQSSTPAHEAIIPCNDTLICSWPAEVRLNSDYRKPQFHIR